MCIFGRALASMASKNSSESESNDVEDILRASVIAVGGGDVKVAGVAAELGEAGTSVGTIMTGDFSTTGESDAPNVTSAELVNVAALGDFWRTVASVSTSNILDLRLWSLFWRIVFFNSSSSSSPC